MMNWNKEIYVSNCLMLMTVKIMKIFKEKKREKRSNLKI